MNRRFVVIGTVDYDEDTGADIYGGCRAVPRPQGNLKPMTLD